MGQSIFQFLFKYRPVVFDRGDLTFAAPWPFWIGAAAVLGAAAVALFWYGRVRRLTPTDRLVLGGLRAVALGVLLFTLAGPALMIATVVPQENFVGVVIDDSRSMRIADDGSQTRAEVVARAMRADGPLLTGLRERFKVRLFRFSETSERLNDLAALTAAGRRTDMSEALGRVQRELSAVPLAGIVILTDGGDNAGGSLTETLLQLQAAGVPVHTVGVGKDRFDRDIELGRVETPRTVLEGTSVVVELSLAQTGYGGQTALLQVEDDGRIVSTREISLPNEGETATVRAHFTVTEPGPRRFRFSVPPLPDERLTENNAVEALVLVQDQREEILYFEGEPRFEVKFLRRAVADDENLRVVTLQRTAENKFLRLDVEDSTELAAGFPRTREELFRYRGLVLGSVEASFFTHDQLQMIRDFVNVRGGGLLTLGGRRSFAEGGYAETPAADVLPVLVDPPSRDSTPFFAEVRVRPTPFGGSHPVTQLRATPEASQARWDSLPPLSLVNPIRQVKAGASVLLTGDADGDAYVVLAAQRYGRGRSVAFPVQDSWMWQMHADLPLDDQTHETLWRQLLRWLVSGVTDRVSLTASEDRVETGRAVFVTAEVADSGFLRLNGADVSATVIDPAGSARSVAMPWTVERDGEYRASFTPSVDGLHEIRVQAHQGERLLGEAVTYVDVGDVHAEYFGAQMRKPLLQRIASETGGGFYTPETLGTLPEDVSFTESGATVHEQRDLWDMPILLLVLLGLVGGEWVYRRLKGLA